MFRKSYTFLRFPEIFGISRDGIVHDNMYSTRLVQYNLPISIVFIYKSSRVSKKYDDMPCIILMMYLYCKFLYSELYSTVCVFCNVNSQYMYIGIVVKYSQYLNCLNLKAQRPKFNAKILTLKGPKKFGHWPKFGPAAHYVDNPAYM